MILKSYKEEDVYIWCEYIDGVKPTFKITDDESSFDFDGRSITSDGFVYILTKEELKEALSNIKSFDENSIFEVIYLNNFTGDIHLILNDCGIENIDLDDYIQHQSKLGWVEISIELINNRFCFIHDIISSTSIITNLL